MSHRLTALLLLCACLGACQTPPGARQSARREAASTEGLRAFEKQQAERATASEQQGDLLDAATAWDVLTLLNPGEYQPRLAAVQKQIDARVQELLPRARQERTRGDATAAEQTYLGVIALQPQNKEAADALRAIERARIRQEHLLKASRTLPPAEVGGKRPATLPVASNPLLMEQASNLASQGELDEAIELMSGQFKTVPGDTAARDLLADLLYKKAQGLQPKDSAATQATLKRCVQVSPKHASCKALLASLLPKKS
ncbi:MAG: hypothetical protein ABI605_05815 [Rhizobacter sp.]